MSVKLSSLVPEPKHIMFSCILCLSFNVLVNFWFWAIFSSYFFLYWELLQLMFFSGDPQTFWYQGPVSWKQFFHGLEGGRQRWCHMQHRSCTCTDEALFTCRAACAAQFLTGHQLELIHGPGPGDPCPTGLISLQRIFRNVFRSTTTIQMHLEFDTLFCKYISIQC